MKTDQYILILILRTLGLSQDEVAGIAHCNKQTVVDADKWFAECPIGEAVSLVDDMRIKRLISQNYLDMPLNKEQLIKVGQITGDDILLRYNRTNELPSKVMPENSLLLERHREKLTGLASTLNTQLIPPDAEDIFSAEVCRYACNKVQGTSALPVTSWITIPNTLLQMKLSDILEIGDIEIRLAVEEEALFPRLLHHLHAEKGQFAVLPGWKKKLAGLLRICLNQAAEIARACSADTSMLYIGRDAPRGLYWNLPAFICQFCLRTVGTQAVPALFTEPYSGELMTLRPQDEPAVALALDTEENIRRCQEVLVNHIEEQRDTEVWPEIAGTLSNLGETATQMRAALTIVIEKGSFAGTCDVCRDYFI